MDSKSRRTFTLVLVVLVFLSTISAALTQLGYGAPQLVVTVQTEKPWYLTGERVCIFGTVKNTTDHPVDSASVAIEVKDSRANTVFLDIVYSGADGSYSDSFRLSNNARVGQYTVYVTASKMGHLTATNQASFNVTTEQLGKTIVSLAGYSFSVQADNQVKAQLNVTLFSESLNWIAASNRLILSNPQGEKVYDNFAGIGGPQDDKSTLIENNTITSVEFAFQLEEPRPGMYVCTISILSFDKAETYDSSNWVPAFNIRSWPLYIWDLGTLHADSYLHHEPLVLWLSRFEAVNYTFRLAESVTDLSVKVFTLPNSEFRCALNASNAQMNLHGEILPHLNVWHNVPAGTYEMNLEMESSGANLIRVVVQAGSRIETPSVKIMSTEATGDFATPSGAMNYKIEVWFNVTTHDTLELTATLDGQIHDSQTYAVEPFKSNQITAYMHINAPSEIGQYTVGFNASLFNLGIYDPASATLNVDSTTYNIIVSPTVRYYQDRLRLRFWEKGHIYVDDATRLNSLDVTNVKILGVDKRDPQTGKPSMVSISFDAANKEKDIHHVISINVGSAVYQLGAVIGGDKPRRMEAHNVPVVNDQVSFTIIYRKWTFGNWVAEVGTKSIKAVVGLTFTAAVPGASALLAVPDILTQLAKYTMLYTAQIWMEQESAYMTIDDATRIIENSGIQQSVFAPFLSAAVGVTRNPFHAFLAAVDFLHDSKKMSDWNYARAYIAALGHILGKASSRLLEVMAQAFFWTALKLEIRDAVLAIVKNEMGKVLNPGCVLKAIGGIIDGAKAIWNAIKILVSPSEEGKEISDAQIGTDSPETVDPVISISFEGQVDYTNDTGFGNTLSMSVRVDRTEAQAIFEVDYNLTAAYLSVFSDPAFRSGFFSGFGFNATQTSLEWLSEDSAFVLEALGSPYYGLIDLQFWMNSTFVQSTQTMSTEASQTGDTAWLNGTLLYPFGKNLTYSIDVTLPEDFKIMQILSNGTYTIENNTITWSNPIDWLAIEFVSPHDVAIGDVTASKTILGQGKPVNINATVSNQGNVTETFRVLAYANSTLIHNQTVTLDKDGSRQVSFSWNTTGFAKGNYTITVSVTELQDEIDTADNTISDVVVLVTLLGDINGDKTVNSLDLSQLNTAYGSAPQSSNWSSNTDIDDDNIISAKDLWTIGRNYGRNTTVLGDINEDYVVNARDLLILGKAFASAPSNPNWNHDADINNDLIVNAIDLEILRKNYGKKA